MQPIKRMAIAAILLAIVGIPVALALLCLDHTRETTLPAPAGPFAVGRTTYVWRDLLVWVWYPAAPRQPSQTLDDYLPAPWRRAIEKQWGVVGARILARDLSRVHAHSIRDAELSPQQRSYPVILMRGGLSALVTSYTSLAEDLASRGYVVVGFDAPYRSSLVVFPDGRVIERSPQNNPELLSGLEEQALLNKLVQAWTADMSFALDQLDRLNASDPSGRFLGRLDMQRVGAFGHSLGGATALQFCHDDARCKTCIDVDGLPWGRSSREGVTQPVLFLMSDHKLDRFVSSTEEMRQADASFASLFSRLRSDRWSEIMIRGSNHYMFGDDAVLRSPPVIGILRALHVVGIDGRRQIAVAGHFIGTFFDVNLRGAPASESEAPAAYPEVEFLH